MLDVDAYKIDAMVELDINAAIPKVSSILYRQLPGIANLIVIVKPNVTLEPHKVDPAFKDICLIADKETILCGVGAFFR